MHATCNVGGCMWWCICIQCFTTGNTISIPSSLVVIRSLCLCNYVFIIEVFALLCHLLHSIPYTGVDIESKTRDGSTPLMYACMNEHRELALALLKHGELLC